MDGSNALAIGPPRRRRAPLVPVGTKSTSARIALRGHPQFSGTQAGSEPVQTSEIEQEQPRRSPGHARLAGAPAWRAIQRYIGAVGHFPFAVTKRASASRVPLRMTRGSVASPSLSQSGREPRYGRVSGDRSYEPFALRVPPLALPPPEAGSGGHLEGARRRVGFRDRPRQRPSRSLSQGGGEFAASAVGCVRSGL